MTVMSKNILLVSIFILALLHVACKSTSQTQAKSNLPYTTPPEAISDLDVKFVEDIAYDTHERAKFDIALPNVTKPTGLLLYIHGGGFINGDKDRVFSDYNVDNMRSLLSQGVAVASINYSLLQLGGDENVGVIKCLEDAKRALQYVRSRAQDFNINKDDIVISGSSAGAGASLWVSMQDDMKDISSPDPVLRESTRVKGVAVIQTQCSYDIEDRWIANVFQDYGIKWSMVAAVNAAGISQFYGVSNLEEYETPEIETYRDKVDMMDFMSKDDPEFWASNTLTPVAPPLSQDIIYHHAFHVRALKERADEVGLANVCYYGKDPILYEDPSGETYVDFVFRKITE